MAHDVFISYSHTDKPVADAVCATLEAAKIRCWVAPRDIMPGKRWGSSIIEAINQSRVVILILTARSNSSDQVLNEIERAVGKGIPILPIRTEEVTPAEDLELFIMNRHWLDAITPPFEQHLERLALTVESLLELRPRTGEILTEVGREVDKEGTGVDRSGPDGTGPSQVEAGLGVAGGPGPDEAGPSKSELPVVAPGFESSPRGSGGQREDVAGPDEAGPSKSESSKLEPQVAAIEFDISESGSTALPESLLTVTKPPVVDLPSHDSTVQRDEESKVLQPDVPKRGPAVPVAVWVAGVVVFLCIVFGLIGTLHVDPEHAMIGMWKGAMYDSKGAPDTSQESLTIDIKSDKTWNASDASTGTWSYADKRITLVLETERGKPMEKDDADNNKPAIFDVADDLKTATSDSSEGAYKGNPGKVVLTKVLSP